MKAKDQAEEKIDVKRHHFVNQQMIIVIIQLYQSSTTTTLYSEVLPDSLFTTL
jgi:hypothetical protein